MAEPQGIKYQYAKGVDGKIVDVGSIDPENRSQNAPYACFGCGGELIPHIGKQVSWHYAHHRQMQCAPETQLHKLAKELFLSTYQQCLDSSQPYMLSIDAPVACTCCKGLEGYECLQKETRSINLTEFFDTVAVEAKVGDFVADVLLSSSTGKGCLLIEFAVTHECAPEKIASNYRIVEIALGQESDAAILKKTTLDTSLSIVKTYNFHPPKRSADVCGGRCPNDVGVFLVYGSGKSILQGMSAAEAAHYQPKGKVIYRETVADLIDASTAKSWSYQELVFKAYANNVDIKNCYLCSYQGTSMEVGRIFCKTFREDYPSNTAAECERFRPRLTRREAKEVQADIEQERQKH